MIDIGFTKLGVIGLVALLVIGPEKLPRVARMAGSLFGRAQRYMNDLKAEVSREMEIEALRRIQQEVREDAAALGRHIDQGMRDVRSRAHAQWAGAAEQSVTQAAYAPVDDSGGVDAGSAAPHRSPALKSQAGAVQEPSSLSQRMHSPRRLASRFRSGRHGTVWSTPSDTAAPPA